MMASRSLLTNPTIIDFFSSVRQIDAHNENPHELSRFEHPFNSFQQVRAVPCGWASAMSLNWLENNLCFQQVRAVPCGW